MDLLTQMTNRFKYKITDIAGSVCLNVAYFPRYHLWGFKKNDKWLEYFEGLSNRLLYSRFDLNDELYGPNATAEICAKQDGFWNLRYASSTFPFTEYKFVNKKNGIGMDKKQFDSMVKIMWPMWCILCGVRKYD